MKKIIGILALAALLTVAYFAPVKANQPAYIGFRAYSSATKVECAVFGSNGTLARDDNAKEAIQMFSPKPGMQRTYALNTKGFANHSTNSQRMVSWTCRTIGASTAATVKVFLNKSETHFLTLSSGTWAIGQ